jgi:pimeloyl-ACP methyl ester carboxylesterase
VSEEIERGSVTRRRRSLGRVALIGVAALAVVVVVLNWTWGNLPDEPAPTGSFVRVGDVRVRYLERPGADPAVVLIHGLPGTADDFDDVTPLLEGRHTIAIDRPGFGFSSGGFHRFDEQVSTLAALLDKLGVKRPLLVGHSYGGTLALAFAASHPDAVRGLVLVDAAAAGTHSENGFERTQAHFVQMLSWPVVQPIADLTFSGVVRKASVEQADAKAFDPNPVDPDHKRRLLAINMRHEDLDAFAGERLESDDVIPKLNKRLATIQTPAVVVQGASDKLIVPNRGRQLAAALPHARLVLVQGGHMVPYTHPKAVAGAVQELLR